MSTVSTVASVDTVWVVLDGQQRVVLLCSGAEAAGVAIEWQERGYRVQPLSRVDVHDV
jgi:hypothetical protein